MSRYGLNGKVSDSAIESLLGELADDEHPLVEFGRDAGVDALRKLLQQFGGQKIHVSTESNFVAACSREVRNRNMRKSFRGNYGQLVFDLDLSMSERQCRRIVSEQNRRYARSEPRAVVKIDKPQHAELAAAADFIGVSRGDALSAIVSLFFQNADALRLLESEFRPALREVV